MKNKRGYQKLLAFIKNKEVIKASCIYKNKKGFEKAFLALYAKTKKPGNGNKSYCMSNKTVIR